MALYMFRKEKGARNGTVHGIGVSASDLDLDIAFVYWEVAVTAWKIYCMRAKIAMLDCHHVKTFNFRSCQLYSHMLGGCWPWEWSKQNQETPVISVKIVMEHPIFEESHWCRVMKRSRPFQSIMKLQPLQGPLLYYPMLNDKQHACQNCHACLGKQSA